MPKQTSSRAPSSLRRCACSKSLTTKHARKPSRKLPRSVTPSTTPRPRTASKQLSAFFKSYKCNGTDFDPLHFCLLEAIASILKPSSTVLYPGSHRHITPSLFFPHVTYVNNDPRLRIFFSDVAVNSWVDQHKVYSEPAQIGYACEDFGKSLPAKVGMEGSFDLMISASAGIVSTLCWKYLKPGAGYLLVSDAHFDAKEAFLHPHLYEPVAFWDGSGMQNDKACFAEQFLVSTKKDASKQQNPITKEQLAECTSGLPRARWSFTESSSRHLFFLFRRR